jgi:hypothetical protein
VPQLLGRDFAAAIRVNLEAQGRSGLQSEWTWQNLALSLVFWKQTLPAYALKGVLQLGGRGHGLLVLFKQRDKAIKVDLLQNKGKKTGEVKEIQKRLYRAYA